MVFDIWGDGLYHDASSVCTAGVHDGRITIAKGGRVTVLIREGALNYPAVRKNGVTSLESIGQRAIASFEFLPVR